MEKMCYANHWNKTREFNKKRSSRETKLRLNYFESLREPLQHDIEIIVGPVERLELIGSVSAGAAETDSDIDILIVTPNEFTQYEFETGPQLPLGNLQHMLNEHTESQYTLQLFCLVRPSVDDTMPPSFFDGTMKQIEQQWNQPWNPYIACVF